MADKKGSSEAGEEIFSDVFGVDEDEKRARERLAKETAEKEAKQKASKGEKEEKELPSEKEEPEIVALKKTQKKPAQKIPVEAKATVTDSPEQKELKQKIKKVILAKAAKAAEKDSAKIFDKEIDIKEKGVKEKEKEEEPEPEEENEKEDSKEIVPKFALNFLQDSEGSVFIGRKTSVFQEYGNEAGLYIGNIAEPSFEGKKVLLDGLNPHVVFVCGARGSGKCLTGDTLIALEDGTVKPIRELEHDNQKVLSMDSEMKIVATQKSGFFKRRVNKILEVNLKSGKKIRLTPEHPLFTMQGWKPAQELREGSRIAAVNKQVGLGFSSSRQESVCYSAARAKLMQINLLNKDELVQNASSNIFWDEITEKTELSGEFEVFDISVPTHHNFVANDIIVHNSYLLGVLAEELALKNPNVGLIVIDPVGVFWGMRHPNKEEKELEALAKTGLLPNGLNNLKVFIPKGMKDKVPKNTFDAAFSMPASLLTAEDWCLTFGIDRFSPSGLLLEKVLHKTKHGYKTKEGKYVKSEDVFDLEDIIECLHNDNEINSAELGYKADSIRALASRFDAAKAWGVFDERGTPLIEISKENQLTIIDTSFLDDNVSALIIGILARRILAARKLSTRREAASKFKDDSVENLMELGIPPTWLFIDEAHTLIPSGNMKTPASSALVEYVKQGRQPGCSLVFATQQPSAIDTHVLSQLDIIVAHKLVFDDDIKAVYKRTPTIIPKQYKNSNFIKTLPVGMGIVGDRREETSRAFVMKIRPRMSQHEGREAVTSERSSQVFDKSKVLALAIGMAYAQIERKPTEASYISQIVQTLNTKYKSTLQLSDVLDALEKKGVGINPKTSVLSIPDEEAEHEVVEEEVRETEEEVQKEVKSVSPEESISLMAFPANLQEESARRLFDRLRKKKTLGLFGKEELIEKISLKYLPIFHVTFNVFNEKGSFNIAEAYVDSHSGEFLNFDFEQKQFVESHGLSLLSEMGTLESRILLLLSEKKSSFEDLQNRLGEEEKSIEKAIDSLMEANAIALEQSKEKDWFFLKTKIDLPKSPLHSLLTSVKKLPVEEISASNLEKPQFDKTKFQEVFSKIWGKVQIKSISEVFLPRYEAIIRKQDNSIRAISVDAYSGKEIAD
ncbi:MAG: DUF853 family protein [Candidatus ainarchaeum sp.]|nr:DUF853 family protein [Candidatus ainarchaeum sp.]